MLDRHARQEQSAGRARAICRPCRPTTTAATRSSPRAATGWGPQRIRTSTSSWLNSDRSIGGKAGRPSPRDRPNGQALGQAQPPPQMAAAGAEAAVTSEGDERPVDGRVGRRAQQLPRRIGPLKRTAAATRRQAARNTAASCSRVNSGRPSADDESPGSTAEQSHGFPSRFA